MRPSPRSTRPARPAGPARRIQSPTGEPPSSIAKARCAWRHFTCRGSPAPATRLPSWRAAWRRWAAWRCSRSASSDSIARTPPAASRRLTASASALQVSQSRVGNGRPRSSRGRLRTTAGAPNGHRTATSKPAIGGRPMRAATASRSEEVGEPAERAAVIAAIPRLGGRRLELAAHEERPLAGHHEAELARPRLEHVGRVQRLELGAEGVAPVLQDGQLRPFVAKLRALLQVAPDRADVADEERGEQAGDDQTPGGDGDAPGWAARARWPPSLPGTPPPRGFLPSASAGTRTVPG